MKQIAKKITEYVKKSKRAKLYGVFGLIYLIAVIFVMNDAWLYQTPIAKLTKVETSVAGESKSTRGTQEIKYKQKIRGVILNGTNKGKIVDFSNEYTYTGMLKQKYHKGDKVLLNGSENNVGSSIQCEKRYGTYYFAWSFNIGIDDDCGKERLAYNCDSGNQYCDIYSRIPKKR